jgi:hypothetical protein
VFGPQRWCWVDQTLGGTAHRTAGGAIPS